jgi:hypothetical protein
MRFEAKVDGMQKRPCAAAFGFLRAELFAEVGQLHELHGNQQRSHFIAPYCRSLPLKRGAPRDQFKPVEELTRRATTNSTTPFYDLL